VAAGADRLRSGDRIRRYRVGDELLAQHDTMAVSMEDPVAAKQK
jgi:hypothetical protein